MAVKKYFWAPAEDDLLRRKYNHRREVIDEIRASLPHYPRWQILRRAAMLGLARTKEPNWTAHDEMLLEQWMPLYSVKTIAKRLRRTLTAVALKSKRIGCRKTAGGYTANGAARSLGCDIHKVTRWIAEGRLRARRRRTERGERQGGDCYYIDPVDLRDFIRRNPDEVSFRVASKRFLIEVLTTQVSPIVVSESPDDDVAA